eukprot:Seg1866.5 transcript_id=Seg1866.5/GoldUCD/mRNA.D3Y31 product="hypothetical protein" protein_id=Seg1866.5/GoldUCD/D3Y31
MIICQFASNKMAHSFCAACGSKVKDGDRFCVHCGKIIEVEEVKDSANGSATATPSLASFMAGKTEERVSRFERKRRNDDAAKADRATRPRRDRHGQAKGQNTRKQNNESILVLDAAITKHSDHDQYFCSADEYVLLYPDQKLATEVPGSGKSFTVPDYKKELSKPYSKLDLYICRKSDFEGGRDGPESHKQAPVIVVKNEIVDLEPDFVLQSMDNLADLQFPSFADVMSHAPEFSQDPINNVQTLTSTSQTTTTEQGYNSFFGVPNSRCPVCNKKFIVSMIEEHVDSCLQSKETPFIALQSSDEEAEGYRVEQGEAGQSFPEEQMSSSERKRMLVGAVKACQFKSDTDVTLNIRRGHEFADFSKFFKKSWNKDKQGGTYRIYYVEMFVGRSRERIGEFFSVTNYVNMVSHEKRAHALPVIAWYLVGHPHVKKNAPEF